MSANGAPSDVPPSPFPVGDRPFAQAVVTRAVGTYIAARHALVERFVDRTFSMRGALQLHGRALGWDVLRAPANLVLAGPQVALKLGAAAAAVLGAPRTAAKLGTRNVLLKTDVAAEVEWRIATGLLELPYRQDHRVSTRDALAETILADPDVQRPMMNMLVAVGSHGNDPAFRERLEHALTAYAGTRAAAADIATGLIAAGVGALALKQLTPGMMTLGPSLAAIVTHQAAVASFPLGAGLGSLWYGVFPAAASPALVVGITGGLMAAAAALAAFAGVIADPVQKRLGLHHARLHRLVDALERHLTGADQTSFAVRDHYVARLLDLLDLVASAYRLTKPA